MTARRACGLVLLLAGLSVSAAERGLNGTYTATAYDQRGITASGEYVHRHVVAADPDLLPIGSRITIKRAGRYSGEYVVADTGAKIAGRRLDIFLPSAAACRKFGRKRVKVRVISLGDGTHEAAKAADRDVKKDVQQEIDRKAVGKAATEDDWAAKVARDKNSTGQEKTTAPSPAPTGPPR